MVRQHPLTLLEEKHTAAILLFLHERDVPVITKSIMNGIGVRNWATVGKSLRRLEEARLVTRIETRIGKYASKAQMWRLEPDLGVKVAAALEDIERWMTQATPQV